MKLFFLTGLPRSGTSWSALAIVTALHGMLIYEPYNWEFFPERRRYDLRYTPIDGEDADLLRVLQRELRYWRRPRRSLQALLSPAVVVKDVHIGLAADYLWAHYRPHTIVLVRHPCAVADSWARLGFEVDERIDKLLSQPRLLADHLAPFEEHMRRAPIDIPAAERFYYQVGLFWGSVYYVLRRYADRHPEWLWVTHESLCADPEAGFERLLAHFGRSQSARGREFLRQHNRMPQDGDDAFSVARVSREEPHKWRKALTPDQIDAVLAGHD